ncbi:MAG: hypothetical protein JF606_08250 [Burkholderiales bacterium]|jgi:hypothetical protein|nr:hypothetical protein [Burkholderiales bacterium]
MLDFSKVELADAEIKSIATQGSSLVIYYDDWKEVSQKIVFQEAISYQSFSPENIALSHGCVRVKDPFIAHSCRVCEEKDNEAFKIFAFVSAWNNEEILVIVAKSAAAG